MGAFPLLQRIRLDLQNLGEFVAISFISLIFAQIQNTPETTVVVQKLVCSDCVQPRLCSAGLRLYCVFVCFLRVGVFLSVQSFRDCVSVSIL